MESMHVHTHSLHVYMCVYGVENISAFAKLFTFEDTFGRV